MYYPKRFFGGKIPTDYVLAYDFNNSLLDKSVNSNHGSVVGNLSFVNAVDSLGKRLQSIYFDLATFVRTTNNVDLSSTDKISLAFWFKSSFRYTAVVIEQSTYPYGFVVANSNQMLDTIEISDLQSGYNVAYSSSFNPSEDVWKFIVMTIDRSKSGLSQNTIYVNAVNSTTLHNSLRADNNGAFSAARLTIGARDFENKPAYPIRGYMAKLKCYPRILSPREISLLFGEA
jgi:hypothetical protein